MIQKMENCSKETVIEKIVRHHPSFASGTQRTTHNITCKYIHFFPGVCIKIQGYQEDTHWQGFSNRAREARRQIKPKNNNNNNKKSPQPNIGAHVGVRFRSIASLKKLFICLLFPLDDESFFIDNIHRQFLPVKMHLLSFKYVSNSFRFWLLLTQS